MAVNPYLPVDWTILDIREEIPDHFFITLVPPSELPFPDYRPGQFFQVSLLGLGEAPFSVASSPTRPAVLEMCIRKVGRLTGAIAGLSPGDRIGLRGPLGNGYPLETARDRHVLLIAGGLGMVPLRSLMRFVADRAGYHRSLTLLYGTGGEGDLLFYGELRELGSRPGVEVQIIVQEKSGDTSYIRDFGGRSGFVTALIPGACAEPGAAFVAMCGPPVFYRHAVHGLLSEGYSKDLIFMSLERRMECGIGKCGHCSVGYRYTCIEGPIFNYWDAFNTPELVEMREGEAWIS